MRTKTSLTVTVVTVVAALSLFTAFALRDRARLGDESTGSGEEEGAAWSGLDEAVVEKYSISSGREPAGPVLPVEEGDLLLFLFCLAGLVGGFAVGYFWRMLVSEPRPARGADAGKV
jgi:hypothetical protein